MTRNIIGICGFIGSGKSTVSEILQKQYNFNKVGFGDRLKDTVATLFDWPRDMVEGATPESREWRNIPDPWWSQELGYDFTPRLALQLFGTECMRQGLDDQIWIKFVKKVIENKPNADFVVTDIRFLNEKNVLYELGAQIWWVQRGPKPDWFQQAVDDNLYDTSWMSENHPEIHESEWRWLDHEVKFQRVIKNNSSIQDLENQIKAIMDN